MVTELKAGWSRIVMETFKNGVPSHSLHSARVSRFRFPGGPKDVKGNVRLGIGQIPVGDAVPHTPWDLSHFRCKSRW